jgi:undecaprenyl diphosphate synthase
MTQTLSNAAQDEISNKLIIPKHVAIIMDGNRRYARNQSINVEQGHIAGAKNLLKITEAAVSLGIKFLTVFAFSTENWLRSDPEIQSLFHIFELYLTKMRPLLVENGIKLSTIGDVNPLPLSLKTLLFEVKNSTKHGNCLELILAINYGGRDDMTRAVKAIAKDVVDNKIGQEDITESLIGKYLYTKDWCDPDLLIRTSGEQRLSNFLLWQISYTEIYIAKTLWPEFTVEHFKEAISSYQSRNKRLGV